MRQKEIELEEEIYKSIIIIRKFNTLLSTTYRSKEQKIKESLVDLNNTIDQLVLIDIHRILCLTIAEYIFLSLHRTNSPK